MKKEVFSRLFTIVLILFTFTTYAQTKPTVYILATGGTIAGTGASEVSSSYKAGAITVDKLIEAVPQIMDIATIKGEQIAKIGSQDMSIEIWIKLAKRINELFSNNMADAVVVTHGTDTQEETAYFLNLVVKSNKPVVLVGSMRPSTAISADGPRNLYNAVACAVDKQSINKGVMVVMDDKILGADDLTKMHTLNVGTFQCPNYGYLGYMYDGKPIYTRNPMKKHTINTEFDISSLDKLPKVEIIMGYANADDLFIKKSMKHHVKGIVYAGVGNGNLSTEVQDALAKAVNKGVSVVRSSRIMAGPTAQWDEVEDDKYGFVASWFLNPQKARILLMLALTKTNDYKEIQRMFVEY